jgi:hypothetical protein
MIQIRYQEFDVAYYTNADPSLIKFCHRTKKNVDGLSGENKMIVNTLSASRSTVTKSPSLSPDLKIMNVGN